MSCNEASCLNKCCVNTSLNDRHGEHDKWKKLDGECSDKEVDFSAAIFESSPIVS